MEALEKTRAATEQVVESEFHKDSTSEQDTLVFRTASIALI